MKNFILILSVIFSIMGCTKTSFPSEPYPKIYNLNFELLRHDGSVYENGEVEISGNTGIAKLEEIINGQYPWIGLGKIETWETQAYGKTLFGEPCGGSNCSSEYKSRTFAWGNEGDDMGKNETWIKDKYWLLRFPNEGVDTLRVHDIRKNDPYTRNFTFFINGQEVDAINFVHDEFAITIQK